MRAKLRDPDIAYRRRWMTLMVLCLSLMVIGLDNTILNVALPTLARPHTAGGLGATASQLQWIVDAYTVVFAGLLLTAGSLGDRFGRYRGLAIGLTIFGIGSALSSFSGSATTLIFTRALMGIGAAFIMPGTLSILTNVFTNPAERAKAIGVWAGVSALGIGLGPLVGGFLLSHFWWGSVFLVNVPVVAAGLVFGYLLVPDSRDPSAPKLDPLGAVLSIAGLTALLWSVIEAPSNGWGSSQILIGFAVGAALMGAFLAWELTYSSPMLDIRVFENPRFSAASGAITLTFLALFGTIFLLTQYLQSVLGYSTLKAGAVLVPNALVIMAAATSSSIWVKRFGNKVVVAFGLSTMSLSMLLFLTLTPTSSTLGVVVITVLLGLGMGNVMPTATESIIGSLPKEKAGVGSAVNDTTRQIGGAVGVAVLGSVLSSRFASHMSSLLTGKVPVAVAGQVKDSVGAALGVARNLPAASPFAPRIIAAAKASFVSGMHTSSILAAGIVLLAAVGVVIWLPARARDDNVAAAVAVAPDDGVSPTDVEAEVPVGAMALQAS
jgi:EmrB/QacA subfamily drug resistance transporter